MNARVLRVFFHPQRGAFLSPGPINPQCARYRGGRDSEWRELKGVQVAERADGTYPHSGTLPEGFLWGEPAKQVFGMGGPALVFGPLERVCRDCAKAFAFSAAEQKHWYEELGFLLDSTAVRCAPCRTRRRHLERARRGWELALRAAEASPSVEEHLGVARAALAVFGAGGRVPIDKALAHCTRAQRLGATAEAERLRAQLRALRDPAPPPNPLPKAGGGAPGLLGSRPVGAIGTSTRVGGTNIRPPGGRRCR